MPDAARRDRDHHDPRALHRRRRGGQLRPPRPAAGDGARRLPALRPDHVATIPPTPAGPIATASCSPPGTARRCSTRSSTWPATTCRWTSCGASASGARRPRATPSAVRRRPGSRRPPGRSGRASPTASGWRWPSASCASATERSVMDHRIYGICSDGDLMEGVGAEAASLAGHLGLGRIVYIYDDNRITIDGSTDLCLLQRGRRGALPRLRLAHALGRGRQRPRRARGGARAPPPRRSERPSLVRVRSVIGWPAPNKAGTAGAHGSPLGDRGGARDQARARPRPRRELRGARGGAARLRRGPGARRGGAARPGASAWRAGGRRAAGRGRVGGRLGGQAERRRRRACCRASRGRRAPPAAPAAR